jgi:hypothetical protein
VSEVHDTETHIASFRCLTSRRITFPNASGFACRGVIQRRLAGNSTAVSDAR